MAYLWLTGNRVRRVVSLIHWRMKSNATRISVAKKVFYQNNYATMVSSITKLINGAICLCELIAVRDLCCNRHKVRATVHASMACIITPSFVISTFIAMLACQP